VQELGAGLKECEAKGEDAAFETLHALLKQEVKPKAVQVVKKDVGAIVPA
jgi:hypothetical protein